MGRGHTTRIPLGLARRLCVIAGVVYLLWGVVTALVRPHIWNPILGRALVSSSFFLLWGASYVSSHVRRDIDTWVTACSCMLTSYAFLLMFVNRSDPNSVLGVFICIMGVGSCMLSGRALWVYSGYIALLTISVCLADPTFPRNMLVPGVGTLLLCINVAQRSRSTWQIEREDEVRTDIIETSSQESLRLRDEHITILSHEIKTPITSIRLRAQMLRRKLGTDPEQHITLGQLQKFIVEMDRQTARLAALVDEMLDVSKIAQGPLPIENKPLDFSEVTREAVQSLEDLLTSAHCNVHCTIEPNITVVGDQARLEQVVLNLLTNASKYARGAHVNVSLRAVEGAAQLIVRDTGSGIAKKDQARIFSRFERAVPARNISGLGLGLFICKEIVAAHQGEISLESEVGQGAMFTVTLPSQRVRREDEFLPSS